MTESKGTQLIASGTVVINIFNLCLGGAREGGARWLWRVVLVLWLFAMRFWSNC